MAQQQEGWPLGLRLLNARIGLVRSHNNETDYSASASASASFTTLLTPSLSSASMGSSSSHLDSQSTGSFFHDKSNTLGSLIGISSIFELSRRSTRGRMVEPFRDNKKNYKLKPWLFSLCSRLTTDAVVAMNRGNNVPSLGHYLEEERRAANASTWGKRTFSYPHGVNDFSPVRDSNSLFLGDQVAAPECAAMEGEEGGREPSRALLGESNGYRGMVVFPCLCG